MRLELFPFQYRDPLTRKWVRARYVAERHVIAERYAEYEIIGPPEIRDVDPDAAHFNPHTNRAALGNVSAVIAVARSAVGECRRLVIAGIAVLELRLARATTNVALERGGDSERVLAPKRRTNPY